MGDKKESDPILMEIGLYIYLNASKETKYCFCLLEGEIILTMVIMEGFRQEVVPD